MHGLCGLQTTLYLPVYLTGKEEPYKIGMMQDHNTIGQEEISQRSGS